jgi:hypothetical protein
MVLLTKNKGPNRLLGKWQKKGGGRTQIEHSMLVNASVQKNPDDSGFSELVHLRALKTGVVPGAQGPDYVQKKIIGKREGEKRKQWGRKELGLRDSGTQGPLSALFSGGVRSPDPFGDTGRDWDLQQMSGFIIASVCAVLCIIPCLRSICIGCYCRG